MLLAQARTSDGRLLAAPEAIAALEAHALAEYPREAIGYIDRLGGYQPMRNHAPDPTASAQIDKRALLSLIQTGGIRALCHSHPNGPDCPSEQDMRAQMEMDVPFVIVATNGQACAQPFCWGGRPGR